MGRNRDLDFLIGSGIESFEGQRQTFDFDFRVHEKGHVRACVKMVVAGSNGEIQKPKKLMKNLNLWVREREIVGKGIVGYGLTVGGRWRRSWLTVDVREMG
ncbi:hypothetical protein L2E82_51599 [Cichorium intybus]|nr:hypothetical protein L2E82_51599 [Cichorium intybus]